MALQKVHCISGEPRRACYPLHQDILCLKHFFRNAFSARMRGVLSSKPSTGTGFTSFVQSGCPRPGSLMMFSWNLSPGSRRSRNNVGSSFVFFLDEYALLLTYHHTDRNAACVRYGKAPVSSALRRPVSLLSTPHAHAGRSSCYQ